VGERALNVLVLNCGSSSLKFQVTREGSHELSSPMFMVQEPELLADMAAPPRGDFIQRAIDRGDPILTREYAAPVFEIDTPADLAVARRFFSDKRAEKGAQG